MTSLASLPFVGELNSLCLPDPLPLPPPLLPGLFRFLMFRLSSVDNNNNMLENQIPSNIPVALDSWLLWLSVSASKMHPNIFLLAAMLLDEENAGNSQT